MGINYFRRDDRDTKFVLFDWLDMDKLLSYEAFQDFETDDVGMIIEEALKVCREAVGLTLQDADNPGCKYEDGRVTVPPSMHEALENPYRKRMDSRSDQSGIRRPGPAAHRGRPSGGIYHRRQYRHPDIRRPVHRRGPFDRKPTALTKTRPCFAKKCIPACGAAPCA